MKIHKNESVISAFAVIQIQASMRSTGCPTAYLASLAAGFAIWLAAVAFT